MTRHPIDNVQAYEMIMHEIAILEKNLSNEFDLRLERHSKMFGKIKKSIQLLRSRNNNDNEIPACQERDSLLAKINELQELNDDLSKRIINLKELVGSMDAENDQLLSQVTFYKFLVTDELNKSMAIKYKRMAIKYTPEQARKVFNEGGK